MSADYRNILYEAEAKSRRGGIMTGAGMSLAGIAMILAAVYEISDVFSEWGWLALSFWYLLSAVMLLPGLGILYDGFASKGDADYVEEHADQIDRLRKVETSSNSAASQCSIEVHFENGQSKAFMVD